MLSQIDVSALCVYSNKRSLKLLSAICAPNQEVFSPRELYTFHMGNARAFSRVALVRLFTRSLMVKYM